MLGMLEPSVNERGGGAGVQGLEDRDLLKLRSFHIYATPPQSKARDGGTLHVLEYGRTMRVILLGGIRCARMDSCSGLSPKSNISQRLLVRMYTHSKSCIMAEGKRWDRAARSWSGMHDGLHRSHGIRAGYLQSLYVHTSYGNRNFPNPIACLTSPIPPALLPIAQRLAHRPRSS